MLNEEGGVQNLETNNKNNFVVMEGPGGAKIFKMADFFNEKCQFLHFFCFFLDFPLLMSSQL